MKTKSYWTTSTRLYSEEKLRDTEDVEIQHGIFQGGSLSPLLFCISLIHHREQLNRLNIGYEEHTTKTKVSHLLHMDDLKLIRKTEEELQKQMQIVTSVMTSIWNSYSTSVQTVLQKATSVHSQNLTLDINREIQALEQGKTYKDLGNEETESIKHEQMTERLKKEYTR
jgi:hypothetical protein